VEDDIRFEASSGNVFADLGLENAEELLNLADLAHGIMETRRRCGLTRKEFCLRVGLTLPELEAISRMRLDGFTRAFLEDVWGRCDALGGSTCLQIPHDNPHSHP
jgi:Helix-turn-helix domain